ncbi:MarR family winged helix-turn-helix transcriptional regulator [Thermosediminibacter litoriperuensis]|uniref:DNA-binding MarR family transcriptional regulator n=1 Tax=Thermosediminibacter litoriperuensis TaxID=291989 RepID=A0A5S5AQ38_9FIRM|nr:MarR family winged helix-turn-helix transcriptional regulator [Thermosediminibacter litoriperuensis]TYP53756.1 DNA-binding MarR family transcriptional regulator [Thermosediminibacter litoriperuensis]
MENKGSHYLRELIRMLVRNLGVLEKSEASCCGTTLSQCHAIVEIGRAGEISLNELAELLNLDNSTISRSVNNLVNQGLVSRETDPEDRRYVRIRLTEEGYGVYRAVESSMEDYFERIFTSIPEEKRGQVLESLQILIEAVRKNKCC